MTTALAAAALWCAVAARAADPVQPAQLRALPGTAVELAAKDGWKLKAVYSPAQEGRLSIVLLHGTGGRKEDWYRMAKALAKRGFGYVALDLRGHGESRTTPDGKPAVWRKFVVSKNYNEYLNMMEDVAAAVAYLETQGVPDEQIALLGADVGSSLALRYAALHPKIPMVGLLSPRLQYQDVTTVNAMRAYKDRPVLMVYSEADKGTAKELPILQHFAKMSAGERQVTVLAAPAEHGVKMLRGPVVGRIIDWFENPTQQLDAALAADTATVNGETAEPAPTPSGSTDDDAAPAAAPPAP